jgi:hypothetical protein
LVDPDYMIMAIIDWELAFFTLKETAFHCPLFMVDVEKLYGGWPIIGTDEELFAREFECVKRPDITNIARNGRKHRCIEFSLYTDAQKRDDFESLAWRVIKGEDEFLWETWKKAAQVQYPDPFKS